MDKFWEFRQDAKKQDTLELYVYSTVERDGWWYESETSAKHFRDELAQHPNAKEIKVYINSLGGSVMEGIAIYNQLKRHSAHKTVYVDGFACSIASVIAMAGDTVIMPKNAVMMIHNAWSYAIGNAAQQLNVTRPTIYRWMDDRTLSYVKDDMSGRTFVVRKDIENLKRVAAELGAPE